METETKLANVNDLEERYGLPVSFWYTKAERGEVPSLKVGKYRLFRISEVDAWLERHRQGAPTA